MKCLVTGGAGYFGSILVSKLIEKGISCRILDISNDHSFSDVEFIQGDIRDSSKVKLACKDVDVIFHNVAQVPLAKNKSLFNSVNFLGTYNLLKIAEKSGVSNIVYTSSSAIFGVPNSLPVTLSSKPIPGEAYGLAKLKGELLCQRFHDRGMNVSIIRPRTIMGHGRLGIFQILFDWIRQGQNIPVLGKGDNLFQFIHAEDLAEVCILASKINGFNVYNCGTDRFGTMREVLDYLCEYASTGSKVVSVPKGLTLLGMRITSKMGLSPLGAYHSMMYGESFFFDIKKEITELNWHPKFSNDEMFRQSYDWYLSNRKSLSSDKNISHHRSPLKQGVLKLVKKFI